MTDNTVAQVPPGWYPTPNRPGYFTYWDGQEWQASTEQHVTASPAAPQPVVNTFVQAPPKRVNHALHLILTVVTFGLWLPVWAIISIANS